MLFFDIPVPAQLANRNGRRRLTVTVVHAPEVQRWGLERYFGTDLKWRMFRGDKSRDDIVAAMSESDDEDDDLDQAEPQRPGELKFAPSLMIRSRGTVQHGVYEWNRHRNEYSEAHYTLAVAASKRWSRNVENVPLAVVVRLEDLGRHVQVYSLVRAQLEAEAVAEARA